MINSYDIETFDEKNKIIPYCICFLFKNKYYSIYYEKNSDIILKSIDYIFSLNLNKDNIFYIHNLNFDGILIISSLTANKKYKFDTFIKENSIYFIKITYLNKNIEFRCSYKILPISLKNISKSFNLPEKIIFPYKFSCLNNLNYIGDIPDHLYFNSKEDYIKFLNNNKNFNFKEYSIKYCNRDVEIVSLFIKSIIDILKNISTNLKKSYSAPSLSLKIFSEKFNKKNIKLTQNNFTDKYIRDSYFGGRCEVYGNPYNYENVYHFDFSGMYSQCMLEKFCFGSYKINTFSKNINKPGYYFIHFYSDMDIPVLPHHSLLNNKLLFCNGEMKGIYWFEEILLFLKMGGKIKKIEYCIEFDNYDYIFEDFVYYFNKIKEKGNDYKTFGKLMINSLYGRLGMRETNTDSIIIKKEEYDIYYKKYKIIDFVEINDFLLIKIEISQEYKKNNKIPKTKNNISLASAITSKARIKLYNAQQSVIKNGGRVLYSDTDSIFAAYKRNVLDEKHGEIIWDSKKEDTELYDCFFMNPKSYGIVYKNRKEIIKMKGYNNSSISFNHLKEKFYSNEDIKIESFFSIKKSNFILEKSISDKIFNISLYDKRTFTNNKKETIPINYKDFVYYK